MALTKGKLLRHISEPLSYYMYVTFLRGVSHMKTSVKRDKETFLLTHSL